MLSFKPNFLTLLFHFHQEAFEFLFTFCHKGGAICISEVIDISPGNLDSSLCFFQPSISHDVLCGEGNGIPLQYSCLENPIDGGAWRAAVYGVTQATAGVPACRCCALPRKTAPTALMTISA